MFPERLRFLREQKNLTQPELGKIFNLSKQTISAYENGDTSPPIDTVVLFADFFGVTTDFLLGKQTEAVEEEGLFYGLDEDERETIRRQAAFLRYEKKLSPDARERSFGSQDTEENGDKIRYKKGKRKTGS